MEAVWRKIVTRGTKVRTSFFRNNSGGDDDDDDDDDEMTNTNSAEGFYSTINQISPNLTLIICYRNEGCKVKC